MFGYGRLQKHLFIAGVSGVRCRDCVECICIDGYDDVAACIPLEEIIDREKVKEGWVLVDCPKMVRSFFTANELN